MATFRLILVNLVFLLVFAVVTEVAAQTCISPPAGLVSWWPEDGNANDIIGSNDGSLQNGATFQAGMVGQAFLLDGVDDYINVPDSPSLDLQTEITIESWVYINAFPDPSSPWPHINMQVLQKDGTGSFPHVYALPILDDRGDYAGCSLSGPGGATARPRQFGLELTLDNQWSGEILCTTGGGIWSNTKLQENTWYHLAATYNGSQASLYVNGQLKATYSITGKIGTSDYPLQIGHFYNRGFGGGEFNGLIDEIRIYNRGLTSSEIAAIYNAGSAGMCKAPHLVCQGFEPPMDNGPVTVKKNRVLPFKATLLKGSAPVTNLDIVAPPVIQVLYNSGIGDAIDVTDYALPAGQGTEGNQFEFDGTWWHFNLETKKYTAAGTYTVSMVSGDATEYVIDPTCTAQFVIE